MAEAVTLVLTMAHAGAARREVWRVDLTPAEIVRNRDRVIEDFRAQSGAFGMAMTVAEVRERCWAPMAAKLIGLVSRDAAGHDGDKARFAELALCFLATIAFRHPATGQTLTVIFEADGTVAVRCLPPRLLGQNPVVLGNYREDMARLAAATTLIA